MKYRIKLSNNRIIGPFAPEQFQELRDKGHIQGNEQIQEFPAGDWKSIGEIFQKLKAPTISNQDATFMRKIADFDLEKNKSTFSEPEPEIPAVSPVELPSTPEVPVTPENYPDEFEFKKNEPTELKLENSPANASEEVVLKPDIEKIAAVNDDIKTVVVSKKALMDKVGDDEKTRVNIARQKMKVVDEPAVGVPKISTEATESTPSEEEVEADIKNDATQFISFEKEKDKFLKEIQVVEKEIEVEEKKVLFETMKVAPPPKKKKKLLLIAGALLAILLLIEEPKQQKELPVSYPQIHYPIKFDPPDHEKARSLFKKGMDVYNLGTYKEKIRAAIYFKDSVENDFLDNSAMGMLLSCYAEILEASKNIKQDANMIYKLINVITPRLTEDPNIVYGVAKFFNVIKKYDASTEAISRYLVISKPSLKVFAIYLDSLAQAGDLQNAKKVYDMIKQQGQKPREAYVEIVKFDIFNQNFNEAAINLSEGLQAYPTSVELLLLKARLDIHADRYGDLSKTLDLINKQKADYHPHYYSNLLEFTGMYLARQSKPKEAYQMFTQALQIHESPELRAKLASLKVETTDTPEISKLINQSQAINLMNKASVEIKNEAYEKALALLINAVDLAENYTPARVMLSQVQIELGYFKQAINSLVEIVKNDSLDPSANFALLDAYTKAFKFADAKRHIGNISNTNLRDQADFTRLVGEMYYQMNDSLQALSWLSKAVDADPLDDRPYDILSRIYLSRKDFKRAKILLSKAIELEPKKPTYRVSYARVIYEMEDADTALGYLRGISQEFSIDPEVQGEIAILYYRSGQMMQFEQQKGYIEGLPEKNYKFYEFMANAAMLDQKFDQVVEYSKKKIELKPGDLESRILSGKILMEQGKLDESLAMFQGVQDRLPNYPRLMFYISKLYLMAGESDKAIEAAKKEMTENPDLAEPHILLGNIYKDLAETKSDPKLYNEAEKYYKSAQAINPNSPDALIGIADISQKKNQYEVALDLYRRALSGDTNNPELHKKMGDTYRKLGQGKLAIESYKVFLELSPETKYRSEIEKYIMTLQ
ncbi:MAG: tetratricopeptide repeat protein [Bacteriovoracaceae bacterium]|nr:tetratricopeptide repeat protein [Bacteriovoracaceae bacterium]